jgi:hypothetical protein
VYLFSYNILDRKKDKQEGSLEGEGDYTVANTRGAEPLIWDYAPYKESYYMQQNCFSFRVSLSERPECRRPILLRRGIRLSSIGQPGTCKYK